MPFNPNIPVDNSTAEAAELRDQFNALKALYDAQQAQINSQQATIDALQAQSDLASGDLAALQTTVNDYIANHP